VAVLVGLPEQGVSLELIPLASQVLLQPQSNFTVVSLSLFLCGLVTCSLVCLFVCSGWSEVSWRLPRQELEEGNAAVEKEGSRSVLQLFNVTWRNSGRYACEESASDQVREMDIFVPGRGDPTIISRPHEWFVPAGSGVVMKDGEEATIPCAVSDPLLNVSLYRRGDKTPASGPTYEPGRGFTGRLDDSSYVCVASSGSEETRSQVYYVFSVVGEFRPRATARIRTCPRRADSTPR
uniref:Ig-like domain-containing protein n=1 Tax=Hippocampus comes TaxID=109280 RepID=A0A3Q2YU35_HIPCM